MSYIIPEGIFDKYNEMIDATITSFGINCQLVSINKIEEIVNIPNNNIPEKNSVNAHRNRGGNYERGQKIIKEVETLTPIKLKVYWDPRQWINITDTIKAPDGSIQTIGYMSDLTKVLQAKALIVHDDIKNIKELRFERYGEYTPAGFKHNRYFTCLWRRV
jgi:hypothetical protein